MKKIFIYACEQTYGGYHGINTYWVDEVAEDMTEEEAFSLFVPEASIEVMESYSHIIDDFYAEAEEICDNEDDIDECVEELINQNIDGYVAFIKPDITLSVKELDKIACELGDELFVEKYCIREMNELTF